MAANLAVHPMSDVMLDFSRHGDSFSDALAHIRDDAYYDKSRKLNRHLFDRRGEAVRVLPLRNDPPASEAVEDVVESFLKRGERFGAHPELLDFVDAAVAELDKYSIPMFAHEIIRDEKRQQQLFDEGFSKVRTNGAHTLGCAVDLIHIRHGWNLTNEGWLVVGHILKDLCSRRGFQMIWGGDWKADGTVDLLGWDPAHWELAYYRQASEDWPFSSYTYHRDKHRLQRFSMKAIVP